MKRIRQQPTITKEDTPMNEAAAAAISLLNSLASTVRILDDPEERRLFMLNLFAAVGSAAQKELAKPKDIAR
jgi:hypothetical protein